MNKILFSIASVALALAAAPVVAQPAPAAAAPAAAAHFSTAETNIGDMIANPATKAILDKHIPGLSDSPQISMASAMTLRTIQPMSNDQITEKMLNDIDADLAKLPAK